MRTILTLLALLVATSASFAQGKITIGNDANHLCYDVYAGALVSQATGWNSLTMQLWAGTNSSSMTLQTSFVGAAIGNPAFDDGRINNSLFILNGIAGGQLATLQLRFLRTSDFMRIGATDFFTVVPGSFAYNSIVLPIPPGYSTWAPGSVNILPEPSSFSLVALGAASLLVFHRRKCPPRRFDC